MGHGHGHGVAEQAASASGKHVRKLWIAVGLGLVTFVTQVIVGLSTSSLALLSDSAHVFTDVFGILMALTAILLAQRARSRPDRTFGMYRAEVFAALFNALLLFGVAGWVLYEALGRLSDPPEVPGLPVSIVAVVGLVMNIAAFLLLRSGAKESINVRGAYLEVMADMLGSVGVLISGLVTLIFGWRYADPVIGVAIGLFVPTACLQSRPPCPADPAPARPRRREHHRGDASLAGDPRGQGRPRPSHLDAHIGHGSCVGASDDRRGVRSDQGSRCCPGSVGHPSSISFTRPCR